MTGRKRVFGTGLNRTPLYQVDRGVCAFRRAQWRGNRGERELVGTTLNSNPLWKTNQLTAESSSFAGRVDDVNRGRDMSRVVQLG